MFSAGNRVGFVGIGNMGLPMIKNLRKSGFQVKAFDIFPAALEAAAAEGFEVKDKLADVAKDVDYIVTCLPAT